jgi:hypothetical protein
MPVVATDEISNKLGRASGTEADGARASAQKSTSKSEVKSSIVVGRGPNVSPSTALNYSRGKLRACDFASGCFLKFLFESHHDETTNDLLLDSVGLSPAKMRRRSSLF